MTLNRQDARFAKTLRALTLALVGVAMAPAACARTASVQGRPIAPEQVARIVAGGTTEAELRDWLGDPADVVMTDRGRVLTWQHRASAGAALSLPFLGIGGGGASGQLLIVTLDREGRVARHTFIGGP